MPAVGSTTINASVVVFGANGVTMTPTDDRQLGKRLHRFGCPRLPDQAVTALVAGDQPGCSVAHLVNQCVPQSIAGIEDFGGKLDFARPFCDFVQFFDPFYILANRCRQFSLIADTTVSPGLQEVDCQRPECYTSRRASCTAHPYDVKNVFEILWPLDGSYNGESVGKHTTCSITKKYPVWLWRRIKNRRHQIQTFDLNNN